jgi:D-3-phosphoglycerate dehydrogenase
VRDGGVGAIDSAIERETHGRVREGSAPLAYIGPEDAGRTARIEAEERRHHRVLHFHRNVPGVLSKMHALIADLGVNIAAEYLQTNREVGYVVLDVEPTHGDRVLAGLKSMPETIRVRMLW